MDRGAWEATVHGVAKSQTQHTTTRKQQHGGVVGGRRGDRLARGVVLGRVLGDLSFSVKNEAGMPRVSQ